MHDPRIGRFFAIDPLAPQYPYYSTYAFSGNRVIDANEIEGLEPTRDGNPGEIAKDLHKHTGEMKTWVSSGGQDWSQAYDEVPVVTAERPLKYRGDGAARQDNVGQDHMKQAEFRASYIGSRVRNKKLWNEHWRVSATSEEVGLAVRNGSSYHPETRAQIMRLYVLGAGAAEPYLNALLELSVGFAFGIASAPRLAWSLPRTLHGLQTSVGAANGVNSLSTVRSGGRLGNAVTRKQNYDIATILESRGYTITGGGGRKAEEYLRPLGGGRKGGSYPDITATHPNYPTLRINTVDVLKNGVTPSKRELRNAIRIRTQIAPGEHLILIPKR